MSTTFVCDYVPSTKPQRVDAGCLLPAVHLRLVSQEQGADLLLALRELTGLGLSPSPCSAPGATDGLAAAPLSRAPVSPCRRGRARRGLSGIRVLAYVRCAEAARRLSWAFSGACYPAGVGVACQPVEEEVDVSSSC